MTSTNTAQFTEACLNNNTLDDLRDMLDGPADHFDMEEWELTEAEWRKGIRDAIATMEAEDQ